MITCKANVSRSLWLALLDCSQPTTQPLVSVSSPTLCVRVGARKSWALIMTTSQYMYSGRVTFSRVVPSKRCAVKSGMFAGSLKRCQPAVVLLASSGSHHHLWFFWYRYGSLDQSLNRSQPHAQGRRQEIRGPWKYITCAKANPAGFPYLLWISDLSEAFNNTLKFVFQHHQQSNSFLMNTQDFSHWHKKEAQIINTDPFTFFFKEVLWLHKELTIKKCNFYWNNITSRHISNLMLMTSLSMDMYRQWNMT